MEEEPLRKEGEAGLGGRDRVQPLPQSGKTGGESLTSLSCFLISSWRHGLNEARGSQRHEIPDLQSIQR